MLDKEGSEIVGVVGLVGDQIFGRWDGCEQGASADDVGGLPRRQQDGRDATLAVAEARRT